MRFLTSFGCICGVCLEVVHADRVGPRYGVEFVLEVALGSMITDAVDGGAGARRA